MSKIFKQLGAWFLKDSGKTFVFGCAAAASGVIASYHIIPQTFLLEKYKEIVQLYKNGFSVPVSKPLRERFQKTLDLLEIPEIDKNLFQPFMVYGFDIFSAGTSFSRYGVIVGLPVNFTYTDGSHIDKQSIQLNEQSVPWELNEGKLLEKSLTLSEEAQMYAMAREIQMRRSLKYFIDTFSSIASFIVAYGIGNNFNENYNLYSKPRSIRMLMYTIVGSFFYWNYIFITDFSQLYYEKQVDEYLKDKNPIFKRGGQEFYATTLDRNVALRKLMGRIGESKYTILGNENYLIRQRHLPLVQRKTFFEGEVEKL